MQKRKLKINILDVTIFVIVICAVVALIFRDTIGDVLGKPEIRPIEVMISTETIDNNVQPVFTVGDTVILEAQNSRNQLQAVVASFDIENGKIIALLKCNGYKKLGRYYTENGDILSEGIDYDLVFGDMRLVCNVQTAEIAG